MRRQLFPFLIALALLVAACAPGPSTPTATPPPTVTPSPEDLATVLNILPGESEVRFTAEALGESVAVQGTYGVLGGDVALIPQEGQLRIRARVLIDTPSVTVGVPLIDEVLRLGMETTTYPVATFEATSTALVPVTEEEVTFTLAGTLTLHGQTQPVTMRVDPATVIGGHLEARAFMDINMADFGVLFPEAIVSTRIALDVTLVADEDAPPAPPPAPD